MTDRLDSLKLAEDAAALLATAGDPHALVADLLRTIRKQDDQITALREERAEPERQAWARAEAAEQERNEYREALRIVKRATRDVRVGRW